MTGLSLPSGMNRRTTSTEINRNWLAVLGEPWLARGVSPQKGEGGRIVSGDHEEGPGTEAAGRAGGQAGLEFLAQPVEDLLENGPIQLFFGLEVAVEDEAGHAARGGDILHRGTVEARSGERLGGPPQDGGSPFRTRQEFGLDRYTCQYIH